MQWFLVVSDDAWLTASCACARAFDSRGDKYLIGASIARRRSFLKTQIAGLFLVLFFRLGSVHVCFIITVAGRGCLHSLNISVFFLHRRKSLIAIILSNKNDGLRLRIYIDLIKDA